MKFPEQFRSTKGMYATEPNSGSGLFIIPVNAPMIKYKPIIFATNGEGWEHVSVSIHQENRCPKWEDMCRIKDLFWDKNETVVQYHPPESEYVNNHKYCLHMWRKIGYEFPLPPSNLIGIK